MNIQKGFEMKVLDKGFVRYIDHMGGDIDILEAARISYKAPSKGEEQDKKLLNYLHKNKHTSPFEMVKLKFNIRLPIFVMRQFVRHRMQNLNEVSARYTQLEPNFYIPSVWRAQDTVNKQGSVIDHEWLPSMKIDGVTVSNDHKSTSEFFEKVSNELYLIYESMIEAGIAREMARMILPIHIYTEIYTCWDLNNLLKFFALRDDSHAQAEIQDYAKAMKDIAKNLFPWTMQVYERNREEFAKYFAAQ